ncbi:hypothetical protein TNCV_182021 [Trichonephila clavipes]|nr:hypothetical protein TNCV_182021 [Trichonephila clavipes]
MLMPSVVYSCVTLTKPSRLVSGRKQYGLTNRLFLTRWVHVWRIAPQVCLLSTQVWSHDMGSRVVVFCWTNRNLERMDLWGEILSDQVHPL